MSTLIILQYIFYSIQLFYIFHNILNGVKILYYCKCNLYRYICNITDHALLCYRFVVWHQEMYICIVVGLIVPSALGGWKMVPKKMLWRSETLLKNYILYHDFEEVNGMLKTKSDFYQLPLSILARNWTQTHLYYYANMVNQPFMINNVLPDYFHVLAYHIMNFGAHW